MPSAAPSSRVASFIAEPAPRGRGTADMIDAVIGDIDERDAGHERAQAQQTYPYGVCGVSRVNSTNPSRDTQHAEPDSAVHAEAPLDARRERRDDEHDRAIGNRRSAASRRCTRARAGSTAR